MEIRNNSGDPLPPISDFLGQGSSHFNDELEIPPPEIPGYRILQLVGRGGMGLVYRALDEQLKRDVAIKLVQPSARTTSKALERFQREAEAVARLQHPNIVQVFSYGTIRSADRPPVSYLVLEFASGGTLAAKIAGKPQAQAEAAYVAQLLALAVQYAHEQGIIHRDLKPQSILITPAPKIADFGLARLLDQDQLLTAEHARPGTPTNMSPEQISGDHPIGPATDIYSLGTILYELLTGRPPFKADSREAMLHLVQHEQPLSPARYAAGISRDLEAICLKCLAKSPLDRYASAKELAADLQAYLELRPTKARPRNGLQRAALLARRHPVPAVLFTIAATVALLWGATLYRYAFDTWRLTTQREIAAQQKVEADTRAQATLKQRQTERSIVEYASQVQGAYDAWQQNDALQAELLLGRAAAEYRGWEWHYLQRLCHDHLLQIDAMADSVFFTPSGQRLVTVGPNRTAVWDSHSGQLLYEIERPSKDTQAPSPSEWRPIVYLCPANGTPQLISANSTAAEVLDLVTGNAEDAPAVLTWTRRSGLFGHDPKLATNTLPFTNNVLISISGGFQVQSSLLGNFPVNPSPGPAPDPSLLKGAPMDEHHVAVMTEKEELQLWSLSGQGKQFTLPPQEPRIQSVMLFGDKDRFLSLDGPPFAEPGPVGDYFVTLRAMIDGRHIGERVKLEDIVTPEGFILSSDFLVIWGLDLNGPVLQAFRTADLSRLPPLVPKNELSLASRLSPWALKRCVVLDDFRSQLLAVGSPGGRIEIWNLADYRFSQGPMRALITPCRDMIRSLAISPWQDRIAAVVDGGQVRVWSLERGQRATVSQTPRARDPSPSNTLGITARLNWVNHNSVRPASIVGGWREARGMNQLRRGIWKDYIGKPSATVIAALQASPISYSHPTEAANTSENDEGVTERIPTSLDAWQAQIGASRLSYLISPRNPPIPWGLAETADRMTVAVVPTSPKPGNFTSDTFTDQEMRPNQMAYGSTLKFLSISKASRTAPVREFVLNPDHGLTAFTISTDGTRVALATMAAIHIHDASNGELLAKIPCKPDSAVCKIAFDRSGERLALGFENGAFGVLRVADGKFLLEEHAHRTPVTLLTFSTTGSFLVTAGAPMLEPAGVQQNMPAVKVWDLKQQQLHFAIPGGRPLDEAVTFNSDDSRLAIVSEERIEIWHPGSGLRLLTFGGHCCAPCALSFNPNDDSMLVSATQCHERLFIWSAADSTQAPLESSTSVEHHQE